MKRFLIILSVAIPPTFLPMWSYWSLHWTTKALVLMGVVTNASDLQVKLVANTGMTVFLIPIALYVVWMFHVIGWLSKEEKVP